MLKYLLAGAISCLPLHAYAVGGADPSPHLLGLTVDNLPIFTGCTGYLYGNGASPATCSPAIPNLFVTPQSMGAVCDGAHPIADQAALASAIADTRPLYFPPGSLCDSTVDLVWSGAGTKVIFGSGASSVFRMNSATQNGFSKTGTGALIVRDITISTSVSKSAGAAISLTGGPSIKDIISGVTFVGSLSQPLYYGVLSFGDVIPEITGNYFLNTASAAISIQNVNASGGAESNIHHNTFDTGLTPSNVPAISYASGLGTLIISDNRFQNYDYGVLMQPISGVSTFAAVFTGNTFESNKNGAIVASLPAASTAAMQSLTITGNNFTQAAGAAVLTAGATNPGWISGITLSGNTVSYNAAYPFNIQAGNSLTIDGNNFTAQTANLGAIVTAAANPIKIALGDNNYVNSAASFNVFNGNTGVSFSAFGVQSATATAGGGAAPPATVLTYITVTLPNGTLGKVPVYGN